MKKFLPQDKLVALVLVLAFLYGVLGVFINRKFYIEGFFWLAFVLVAVLYYYFHFNLRER